MITYFRFINIMTKKHSIGNADILMIITCFLWALGTIVCKNAFGDTPDSFRVNIFNGIRFPIATLLLFVTIKSSGAKAGIKREHLPGIALVSFFGLFLFIISFHVGLSMTTASNTGIIMGLIPLVIVLVSFLCGIEKPSRWLVSGIIVGFCGVLVMNVKNGGLTISKGDFLVFTSCFFWGIYVVYGKKYMRFYSPIVITAWIFLFTSLFHIPVMIYQFPDQAWGAISGSNWLNLAFAAVFPLFIANMLYFISVHRIGPSRSGVYIYLEPVFTVILAFMIRHEHISSAQIIGFLLIIIGVRISKIHSKRI